MAGKFSQQSFIAAIWIVILCITALPAFQQSEAIKNKPANCIYNTPDPVIHLHTRLVTFMVTVTDRHGNSVAGLTKDDFEVFDNKVKQNVEFFSTEDTPISVALVFDLSGSMSDRITRSFVSLREFINNSDERDEYCLITFSDSAKLAVDFTNNANQLVNSLMGNEPEGRTALYDAVYLGLEKERQRDYKKKVILILSDGQDNNSRYSLGELKRLAKESDTLIYALGIVDPAPNDNNDNSDMWGRWTLAELADITGGKAFFPDNDMELQSAIRQIMLELRRQYSIGFSPSASSDGKWHKLQIKIISPKKFGHISVRSRQGYYATK